MTISVPFDLAYEFEVRAPAKEVFEVLADVPTSASHFPKLSKLVDLGDNAYRWEMEKVGTAKMNMQTIYASKYKVDKKKGTIVWTPVKGEGNAEVGGSWTLTDKKATTALVLKLEGTLTLPLPAMMKAVVAPFAISENEKLVEKYIDNLIKRFGGEA